MSQLLTFYIKKADAWGHATAARADKIFVWLILLYYSLVKISATKDFMMAF